MQSSITVIELPGQLRSKESACNARDLGSIPGSGTYPGEGNGNPLQYSCLKNSMDRRTWQAIVHRGHKESNTHIKVVNTLTEIRKHKDKNFKIILKMETKHSEWGKDISQHILVEKEETWMALDGHCPRPSRRMNE